jgi:hypothetical protein
MSQKDLPTPIQEEIAPEEPEISDSLSTNQNVGDMTDGFSLIDEDNFNEFASPTKQVQSLYNGKHHMKEIKSEVYQGP